jgi:hypothetical protein
MVDFQAFPKIPRLNRECVITEKIDGTNAQVFITEDLEVHAGSRNRFVTPENDNYSFAKWVQDNSEELKALGPGNHYGEWWGKGIQRGYSLTGKQFSLFDVGRWTADNPPPSCCFVVPLLYRGPFSTERVAQVVEELRITGSMASQGFMEPEGIIVYHEAARQMFKVLLENDDVPKGAPTGLSI